MKDTQRVLYQMQELQSANPGQWVFVCEGEKSADAIRGLGLIATTSPLGAGKWQDEYSEVLADRKVAVLLDRDPQGQNHALDVVRSLKGIARARRIVTLPAVVAEKSDPADWVAAGGEKDDLLKLLESTPDIEEMPLFWEGEATKIWCHCTTIFRCLMV